MAASEDHDACSPGSSDDHRTVRAFIVLLLLSIPFLFCVNGEYRGLEDNNQYIAEAREWARGHRPPSAALVLEKSEERWGPEYVSPLTPYLWSFVIDFDDPVGGAARLQLLQAVFMIVVIGVTFKVLRDHAGCVAATIGTTLLCANESFRSFVAIPHTEPLAVLLLLTAYVIPRSAIAAAVLQAMVRPPMAVLMVPAVIRTIRDRNSIVLGVVTAALGYLRFGTLLIPAPGRGAELSVRRTIENLLSAGQDTVKNLVPFEPVPPLSSPAVVAAALAVAIALIMTAVRLRRRPVLLLSIAAYVTACATQFGQGIRYLLPLFVLLALELRGSLRPLLRVRSPFALLALWLGAVHLASCGFNSDPAGATAMPRELLALRSAPPPLLRQAEVLMMDPYRLCVVAFDRPCVGVTLRTGQAINKLLRYKVDLIILPEQGTGAADRFLASLTSELSGFGLDADDFISSHERARTIDARAIRESLLGDRR